MRFAARTFFSVILSALCFPVITFAQPAALAELFSSFGCGNCHGPDSAYEVYLSKHPGVVLINYHNTTADPQDEFFQESKSAGSQDRDFLYGGGSAQSDPAASIDGYTAGSIESSWENATNTALANTLPATITASVGYGPGGIDTIHFTVSGGPAGKQVAYYVALKESKIFYANNLAYGNPPDSLWNDIFRAMIPSNGSSAFGLGGTHNFTEIFDPTQYPFTGVEQNMTAVIFVQDKAASASNSYQIEGLDTVSLASSSAVFETTTSYDQLIFPENPLSSTGSFRFSLAKAGNVQISAYDMLGREVRSLVSGTMPSGEMTVELNGTSLPTGVYVARMTVDGHTVDQKEFVTR